MIQGFGISAHSIFKGVRDYLDRLNLAVCLPWLSFPLFLAYLFSTFTWVPAAAPSAPITRIVLRSKSGNNNNSKTHRRISASSWEKSSDRRHTVIVSTSWVHARYRGNSQVGKWLLVLTTQARVCVPVKLLVLKKVFGALQVVRSDPVSSSVRDYPRTWTVVSEAHRRNI